MSAFDCDVLVCGGGVAGLSAAALFGRAGYDTVCVDPEPPVTMRNASGADLRTTAILQPAQALLEKAGLWSTLSKEASELQIMRIIDAGGKEPEPRVVKDFNASDISENPFGWNVPNWHLRHALVKQLDTDTHVDFRPGTAAETLFTREGEARVGLSDGTRLRCRLVIAADGRNSFIRKSAGVRVRTTRYGQKALSFAVTHSIPHDNVSTEIHRSGGPFTLVPLPDYEGKPSSAVVWMETGAEAKRLAALDEPDFEEEMNTRSCGVLGLLKLASRRTVWPIISQLAERMFAQRVALVAEAAHVVPPIGAQGLNMSLGDLHVLIELANRSYDGLGSAEMLAAYHRARYREITTRVQGISLLNRTSMASNPLLRDARALGIEALYAMSPVRKTLMQLGLGARG
ncbi:MAG: UbiH/UbiF family hydroxylase [Pseudomonadota bacterium]